MKTHILYIGLALTVLVLGLQAPLKSEDDAVRVIEKLRGSANRDADAPGKPVIEVNLADTPGSARPGPVRNGPCIQDQET